MQKRSIADELELASHDLDKLIGDARAGRPNARSLEDIEERVHHIAELLLSAVRGPSARLRSDHAG